ncbi:hypothetical protein LTR37_021117 [Vermiconidia calcicola]|uniref:Uncharacterized protein n=1 Tax=Vermiconidia calcicola TaxID=1690605 RepID=A0ACC3M9P4_9PEZI|nr:hypothetical protein LTR37_021117 [Vermiconidia calcicola]
MQKSHGTIMLSSFAAKDKMHSLVFTMLGFIATSHFMPRRRNFETHVCMIMKITEDGLIEQIDEYYNRQWDGGISSDKYTVMEGASRKSRDMLDG